MNENISDESKMSKKKAYIYMSSYIVHIKSKVFCMNITIGRFVRKQTDDKSLFSAAQHL